MYAYICTYLHIIIDIINTFQVEKHNNNNNNNNNINLQPRGLVNHSNMCYMHTVCNYIYIYIRIYI